MSIKSILSDLRAWIRQTIDVFEPSFQTLLALALILGLLVMSPNSYANSEDRNTKSLEQILKALRRELKGVKFRIAPDEMDSYPFRWYPGMSYEENSNIILNSAFLAIFRDLPSDKWVQYHNVFFGYDESHIQWGLKPVSVHPAWGHFFQVERQAQGQWTIYLPESFKNELQLQRFAKLLALMRLDLEQQLAQKFSAINPNEKETKILWISNLYMQHVMYALAVKLDAEMLQAIEVQRLAQTPESPEFLELRALNLSIESMNRGEWLDYFVNRSLKLSGAAIAELWQLYDVIEGKHLIPLLGQARWTLDDYAQMTEMQEPALQRWWHSSQVKSRFRILADAYQLKDSALNFVIQRQSIVIKSCDEIIQSRGGPDGLESTH